MEKPGFMARLRERLGKTRGGLVDRVRNVFRGRLKLDDTVFDDLEEVLIEADLGVETTLAIIEQMKTVAREQKLDAPEALYSVLEAALVERLDRGGHATTFEAPEGGPHITLVAGVNGTGKTTTAGKLAAKLTAQDKKVVLGAADTFRAAAVEQLTIWAERSGATIVKHKEGADPAAVAFDTVEAAVARNADNVIIDTAGRLHTKVNLMEELKKVLRVIRKRVPDAPHEILLVLDATTGQNGLQQARVFTEALNVTGVVLTKLDGTAKGGVAVAVQQDLGVPIKFIGVGESVEDLQPFDARQFVEALFE